MHGDTGLLFQPFDTDDLVRQLQRLVLDRGFARRVGAAGRARLLQQQWTWQGNAERVLAIHAQLVNEARR